jgi:xylulokinase
VKSYFIGIDSSTQSTKAVAWDLAGNEVAWGRAKLNVMTPAPGWAEQAPGDWWTSTVEAVRRALADLDEREGASPAAVQAVGLAWQRETFVALDAEGEPLRPAILWLDQRASRAAAQAREEFGAGRFLQLTGKQLDTTPSFSKLVWMRKHEPALYQRLAQVVDVGAYLADKLVGRCRTCLAGGDSLCLLSLADRSWSEAILEYLGLEADALPDLVPPGRLLGHLTESAAKATGLLAGTPVVAAGGDGQVFAVGVNAPSREVLSLTVGTSLVLGCHWPTYRVGPAYRTMVGCYSDTYLLEGVLRAGADIVRWFVDDFAPGWTEAEMEAQIAAVEPGCQGLLTVPYWKGRMVPSNEPLARGVTVGWSDYHRQAHFYRSILEGMAYEVRLLCEAYGDDLGIAPREIHLGGGGALSATWRQIMADVTGLDVVTSAVESTSLGAAMMAATAVGAYESLTEASAAMYQPDVRLAPRAAQRAIYDDLYRSYYVDLYPLLRPLLVSLGRRVLEEKDAP